MDSESKLAPRHFRLRIRPQQKSEYIPIQTPEYDVSSQHFFFLWLDSPIWAWASSFRRGFIITHFRHSTVGRTPLDEGPARRRDLYLTTHNTHKRQTSGGIRTHDPSKRAAEDPRLRSHGHWDRHYWAYIRLNKLTIINTD
jgi:hypothetical protein